MKDFINIPKSIYVKICRECGVRPVIARVTDGKYIVKCPANNEHYKTPPGIIDLEDWNTHNKI